MIRPSVLGLALIGLIGLGVPVAAEAPSPSPDDIVARAAQGTLSLASLAPGTSLRPAQRPNAVPSAHSTDPGLLAWIDAFRPRALAAGIRPATFEQAFRDVHFDPEFAKSIWDYLASAASETRIAKGREMSRTHAALLSRLEDTYDVDRQVILAIWGMPWGIEVQLPKGFDYTQVSRGIEKMPSDWARLGVRDMDGVPVRDFGSASLLLPAGHQGTAFLVFRNFRAIERYNAANAYVLGVGHLSDRIVGAGPLRGPWPQDDRALNFSERKELQERLTAAGFDTDGIDGRIGPNSLGALRAWQTARGLVPDGYPSLSALIRLR